MEAPDDNFWKKIENEINEPIPNLIKFVLSKSGYNSRICLRNIKHEDVIIVEQFVTENLKDIAKQVKNQAEYNDLRINQGQSFEFLPGHRKLIINIGENLAAATSHQVGSGEILHKLPADETLKKELHGIISKWLINKAVDASVSEI